MTARHVATASDRAPAIWSYCPKSLGCLDDIPGVGMVLTNDPEALINAPVAIQLLDDLGPYSILFLPHQSGISQKEHSMLGSGEKHIGSVGRLEETDCAVGRQVGLVTGVTDKRDNDNLCFLSLCEIEQIVVMNRHKREGARRAS